MADTRYYPRRFERKAQLEIWPQPDAKYTIQADSYARLGRFTQDGDRATIDDDIVFLYALWLGKMHYRHPDAKVYETSLGALLSKLKTKAHGDRRYFRGKTPETPLPRPVVVE